MAGRALVPVAIRARRWLLLLRGRRQASSLDGRIAHPLRRPSCEPCGVVVGDLVGVDVLLLRRGVVIAPARAKDALEQLAGGPLLRSVCCNWRRLVARRARQVVNGAGGDAVDLGVLLLVLLS